MGEDSVRRTDAVPALHGFAGRPPGGSGGEGGESGRAPAEGEAPAPRRGRDEVRLHSGAVAALRLLRERVLADTRQRLGIGEVAIPTFAELVAVESTGSFLSRLLSDQNQLAALAPPALGTAGRDALNAAFEAGCAESLELLAALPGADAAAVAAVAAEFARRLAELET
ncbi:MAG: hypothetical protein NXI31_19005 [bacterium]|nr:hypothetical protein [bacterium]